MNTNTFLKTLDVFGKLFAGLLTQQMAVTIISEARAAEPVALLPAPVMDQKRERYGEDYHRTAEELAALKAAYKFLHTYNKAINKIACEKMRQFINWECDAPVIVSFNSYNPQCLQIEMNNFYIFRCTIPQKRTQLSSCELAQVLESLRKAIAQTEEKMNRTENIYFNYWDIRKSIAETEAKREAIKKQIEALNEQDRNICRETVHSAGIHPLDFGALGGSYYWPR